MYDKIDIYIPDFEVINCLEVDNYCLFESNSSFVKKGEWGACKYHLMNDKKGANSHEMTFEIVRKTSGENVFPPVLHIYGSLRKWYYGALSMDDLTRYDTFMALKCLAESIGLTYEEFASHPLSSVEIALNLDFAGLRYYEVASQICYFKDSRYRSGEWDENYKRFRTAKFSGKIYDKVDEIKKSMNKGRTPIEIKGQDKFLSLYGNRNILRVEFKAHGGANRVDKYLKIRTVRDLFERYNYAAVAWMNHTKKFGFKGGKLLPFAPKTKSAKDVTDYIRLRGLWGIDDSELQAILSQVPAQARKDVRNSIKRLRAKMPDAVDLRKIFLQTAVTHFAAQISKSQRQYIGEMKGAVPATLLQS